MARFDRFSPCPRCGSRDNLALYDDGSGWCFGCHYYQPRSARLFIPNYESAGAVSISSQISQRGTSEAAGQLLEQSVYPAGQIVSDYLLRYDLGGGEFIKLLGLRWHEGKQRLLFPYRDKEGALVCLQGRGFGRGPKYLNWGSTYDVISLLGKHDNKQVVITEDALSAAKVSRHTHAWPALGTQFQLHKLVYLQQHGFQDVVVWLDADKWREGREICDKAKWMGLSARAIYSELDPKSYSDKEILEYLK